MAQQVYSGLALLGSSLDLRPADVVVEGGRIVGVEERARAPARWICPSFFNAHTHLGDTIAMDSRVDGDLAFLVAPPDGLKHRLLAASSPADCVAGMRESLVRMVRGGTGGSRTSARAGPAASGCFARRRRASRAAR
jgi:cytosine/adenosine deaminase-related metal-dependent hydrolase